MKSIQALHAPLLLSLHAKLKHKQQLITPEVVPWLSNDGPTELTLRSQRFRYSPPTKAMHNPILLDLTSPSRSTDMSAFLQIRLVLMAYIRLSLNDNLLDKILFPFYYSMVSFCFKSNVKKLDYF